MHTSPLDYPAPRLGSVWVEKRGKRRLVEIIGFPTDRRGFPRVEVQNIESDKKTSMIYSDLGERFEFVRLNRIHAS